MKRAYKFRIYPNKNQEVKLNRLFFEFQVFPWGKPEWISYEDQSYQLTSSKTPEQKEVHSQVLQNVSKIQGKEQIQFFHISSERF